MNKKEIKEILKDFENKTDRTIVIVDYGNVNKWEKSLGWKIGIKELSGLIKKLSFGKQFLRRFYYGSDYGENEKSQTMSFWSRSILDKARMNRFEIVTKRVKYIHNLNNTNGFDKKCDLDVEMAVDLIKERDNYDNIILFSGDGDLIYAVRYLRENFNKNCIVFCARGHIGREVIDAKNVGIVDEIVFVEDLEYRLNMNRFRY